MRTTTIDVHGVSRIEVESTLIGGTSPFYITRFRLFDDEGRETVVTGFNADGRRVLPIEGADHINHVASSDEPMEVA